MKRIIAIFITFALISACAACQKEEVQTVLTTLTSKATTVETEYSTVNRTETTTASSTASFTKNQTTLADVKTTLTKILTTVRTTAARQTKPSTTRRNYFPEEESTTLTSKTASAVISTQAQTTSKPHTTEPETYSCTISINCTKILDNSDNLRNGKEQFVPSDGMILNAVTVECLQGETVFDILKKACKSCNCSDNCQYCQSMGIQLEYEFTPGYDNYYIEGIHQIYEKDCGPKSGWMFKVNGVFPNLGCSQYQVNDGDVIEWVYTCDLGEDVGAEL